ncbi:MAG: glycosyltransferase [Actinomycetota bacterium]
MSRIVHLAPLHPPLDARIHWRECGYLAENGFEVFHLTTGDVDGLTTADGVQLLSIAPRKPGMWSRITSSIAAARAARSLDADVVHIHDPQVLITLPYLAAGPAKVVMDFHEDLTLQFRHKTWLPPMARIGLSMAMRAGIIAMRPMVDLFVTAWTHPKAPDSADKVIEVHNYPRADEFSLPDAVPYHERPPRAIYLGTNSVARGFDHMVDAALLLGDDAEVVIAGNWYDDSMVDARRDDMDKAGVALPGRVNKDYIIPMLNSSRIGLSLLHPTSQYKIAEPTKIFEYMSVGLPIVGSDMGPTREIVTKHKCGVLVDPYDATAIADAIRYLLDDIDVAAEMGERGLAASADYTWERQGAGLASAYHRILDRA